MINKLSTPEELKHHARLWVWGMIQHIAKLPPVTRAVLMKEIATAALERAELIIDENPEMDEALNPAVVESIPATDETP